MRARMEWAAVVDAHHHALAVLRIGDAHVARDRQRRVRRGHLVHVVDLAAGSFLPVIALAVPAGHPALAKRLQRGHRHVFLAHCLVRADWRTCAAARSSAPRRRRARGCRADTVRAVVLVVAARVDVEPQRARGTRSQAAKKIRLMIRTRLCHPRSCSAPGRRARSRGTACSCPGFSGFAAATVNGAAGSKMTRSAGAPAASLPDEMPSTRAGSEVMRASVAASDSFCA